MRGRLLGEVVVEQLPVARDLTPDLVTFHAGANDVLRPKVDLARLQRQYADAVARLRGSGAEVVLFTVIGREGARGRVAGALTTRFAAFNDHVREVADRHDAVLVDVGAVPAMRDPRLWHEDRLHLAPDGHARVAAAVLEALDVPDPTAPDPGWWREPLPAAPRPARVTAVSAEARWVRRHLLPWVGRRLRGVSSGDTVTPKHVELVELRPR